MNRLHVLRLLECDGSAPPPPTAETLEGAAARIVAAVVAGLAEHWRTTLAAAQPGATVVVSPTAAPGDGRETLRQMVEEEPAGPSKGPWPGDAGGRVPQTPNFAAEPADLGRQASSGRWAAARSDLVQPMGSYVVADRSRRELDFERDAGRLVRLYQTALKGRDRKPLASLLGLAPEATQARRRELWIAAQLRGHAGFAVVPNPAHFDDELGRHLEKLYGLVRQEKVPIGNWRLVTPAWVEGNRAAACNYLPMSLDPSGDFDPGRLERANEGTHQ